MTHTLRRLFLLGVAAEGRQGAEPTLLSRFSPPPRGVSATSFTVAALALPSHLHPASRKRAGPALSRVQPGKLYMTIPVLSVWPGLRDMSSQPAERWGNSL